MKNNPFVCLEGEKAIKCHKNSTAFKSFKQNKLQLTFISVVMKYYDVFICHPLLPKCDSCHLVNAFSLLSCECIISVGGSPVGTEHDPCPTQMVITSLTKCHATQQEEAKTLQQTIDGRWRRSCTGFHWIYGS